MYNLVIVPDVRGLDVYGSLRESGCLILDDLVYGGAAGRVFRRLAVLVAVEPSARKAFGVLRHRYLKQVLPAVTAGQKRVVVVGTAVDDVDLLEYESVVAVRFEEGFLRSTGVQVYGEPVMLPLEYAVVLRTIADSVDEYECVDGYASLLETVVGRFGVRLVHYTDVDVDAYQVVSDLVRAADLGDVWVDSCEMFGEHDKAHDMADYDYVQAIKCEWRDAVATVLGVAPEISTVLALPWYMADAGTARQLCFRHNLHGRMAATMYGPSLVDFVRNRLAATVTADQLVGTWVGVFLYDPVVLYGADAVLSGSVLLPRRSDVSSSEARASLLVEPLEVQEDDAWMYAAVPGVRVISKGSEVASGSVTGRSGLESVFRTWKDSKEVGPQVVEFVKAVEGVGSMAVDVLSAAARDLATLVEGVALSSGDVSGDRLELLGMLPGCQYVRRFRQEHRLEVLDKLGTYPTLADCTAMYRMYNLDVARAYGVDLRVVAKRMLLLSGVELDGDPFDTPVGGSSWAPQLEFDFARAGLEDRRRMAMVDGDGFCYLRLFEKRSTRFVMGAPPLISEVSERDLHGCKLGPYPLLSEVLDCLSGQERDGLGGFVFELRVRRGGDLCFHVCDCQVDGFDGRAVFLPWVWGRSGNGVSEVQLRVSYDQECEEAGRLEQVLAEWARDCEAVPYGSLTVGGGPSSLEAELEKRGHSRVTTAEEHERLMRIAMRAQALLSGEEKRELRMLAMVGDAVLTMILAVESYRAMDTPQVFQERRSARTSNEYLAAKFRASVLSEQFSSVGPVTAKIGGEAVEAVAGVLCLVFGTEAVRVYCDWLGM